MSEESETIGHDEDCRAAYGECTCWAETINVAVALIDELVDAIDRWSPTHDDLIDRARAFLRDRGVR
jgi:hypothetical protein